ncbi:hypothetical protein [Acinetobacter sp.]|uniref:hypothetical protein n=1 Tax=Acinetobacter sp. TaxID=472 RepID=UPI00388CFE60
MTEQQAIDNALQTNAPKDVVQVFLHNTRKELVAKAAAKLVAEDAIYRSFNFNNPELKQIELWAGTSTGH